MPTPSTHLWHTVQHLVEELVEQALRQARGNIASARVRPDTAILTHVLPKIALVFVTSGTPRP